MSRTYHKRFTRRLVEDPDKWFPCGRMQRRILAKKLRQTEQPLRDGGEYRKFGGKFICGHRDWKSSPSSSPFRTSSLKYSGGKRLEPKKRHVFEKRRRNKLEIRRQKEWIDETEILEAEI